MNVADMYSRPSRANGMGYANGPTGPNQSIATSGNTPAGSDAAGAPFAWVGMMLALGIIYVAVRFGGMPRNG